MNWIITKDLLGDEPHVIGKGLLPWGNFGPPSALILAPERESWVEAYLHAHGAEFPFEFRLYDDDGEPYYEGRCGDCTDCEAELAFAPLDWAEHNAGCTTMRYRKLGEQAWEIL